MNVCPETICFVVDPISFIDVPVDVYELSISMSSIVTPESFIACAVWPDLDAKTITEATNPLPLVSRTCFESIDWALFTFTIWVVDLI
jgi:hypothetical protein